MQTFSKSENVLEPKMINSTFRNPILGEGDHSCKEGLLRLKCYETRMEIKPALAIPEELCNAATKWFPERLLGLPIGSSAPKIFSDMFYYLHRLLEMLKSKKPFNYRKKEQRGTRKIGNHKQTIICVG